MKRLTSVLLILLFLGFTVWAVAAGVMTARFTGSGNVTAAVETVAPGSAWALDSIKVHLSAAGGANNLTATIDRAVGAAYDTVVLTQDMTAVTDLYWAPTRPIEMLAGDELDLAWTNASTRTYGIEIVWRLSN